MTTKAKLSFENMQNLYIYSTYYDIMYVAKVYIHSYVFSVLDYYTASTTTSAVINKC